jgi:cell division septation protein DedD
MQEQEQMAAAKAIDTEITLGIGKLLGLFFGLVILCGISLGVGYSLGRNSARQAAEAAAVTSTAPAAPSASSANKPGAAQLAPPKTQDCAPGDNCPPQAASGSNPTNLTFYDTVQQKKVEHPQLTPPEPAQSPSTQPAEAHITLGAGYLVQIAAVRNQDDAKLLSDALRKQQYPVIIAQPGDKLFHVQVGPYADIKEAEAIRSRLVSAGYNAFLKR